MAIPSSGAAAQTRDAPEAERRAQFEKLREAGFEAIYNIRYTDAQAQFEEMVQLEPDHPAGHFYVAKCQWLAILYSMRRLQIGLYDKSSFYTGGKEDQPDPDKDRQFRATVQRALDLAQSRAAKDPRDVEALYYLGAAYSLRAVYEASARREFGIAIRDGKKGVDHHKKIARLDPSYADAFLSIGLYDYLVGTLPWVTKLAATVGGVRGNKKRGLAELRTAAEKGKYIRDDARAILVTIHVREKNYPEALKLVEDLAAQYPRNYLFAIERASLLQRTGQREASYAIFEGLLKSEWTPVVEDLIRYRYGEALFDSRAYDRAVEQFTAVTRLAKANEGLVTQAHLLCGQGLDALGRRDEALAHYRAVLGRENLFDSHKLVRKFIKKAYAPRTADHGPRTTDRGPRTTDHGPRI